MRLPVRELRVALAAVAAALLAASVPAAAVVTVPGSLTFQVTDPSSATTGAPSPFVVGFDRDSGSPGSSVRISVRAQTSNFSPSYPGLDAADMSWTTSGASGGDGLWGTLNTSFQAVFIGWEFQVSGSVDIQWTLAPLPAGTPPGTYTVILEWAFEETSEMGF
jgi:hypothetical protein